MATTPRDGRDHARERPRERRRSVGEHIFIWVAWALAAAFWGMVLTTMVEIFRAAGQPGPDVGAPGVPGGFAYLVMVVVAFLVMALALAWAEFRAREASGGGGEAATAALYNEIDRQGEDDFARRAAHRDRSEREIR